MRAALLTLLLTLALAPAAFAQDQAATAIEALQNDPVYVAPGVSGIDEDTLRARLEDGPGDVYLAALPAGGNPDRVTAAIVDGVGRPGEYAVMVGNRFRTGGSSEAIEAGDAAFREHRDEGAEAVLLGFVDEVAGEGGAGGGGEQDGVGTGGLILLGLAGAGGAALLISRRRRRREQAAEFAEVKDNARDDLVALGDDLRALDIDVEMPDTRPEVKADYEVAVNAYDRADQAWRLARRPDDLEPVGSALEEGRWAMLSANARHEGREPPERLSPCFFDPRHGPSSREVEWAPPHGEPRMVPACEADAQRVERDEDPEMREVTVGGERVPYWQAGAAYAPFAGGLFGFGVLPGLLMGTMLGGAFGADAASGDAGGGDFGGGDFGGGDFGGGDFGGGGFGGGDF